MNRLPKLFLALSCMFTALLTSAEPLALRLVGKVPLAQLKNQTGKPLDFKDLEAPIGFYEEEPGATKLAYGFVRGGKAVFFGSGKQVMDVETGKLEDAIPEGIAAEVLSADGFDVYGRKIQDNSAMMKWDTRTGALSKAYFYPLLHPDGETWGFGIHDNYGIYREEVGLENEVLNQSANVVIGKKQDTYITTLLGFTASGNYWIVRDYGKPRLIDTRTMKLLPPDPEMVDQKVTGDNYIGDSEILVFNRDGRWVAGKQGANDLSAFVWDRINKRFLWKDEMISEPSAFSPNDKFLYCGDTIVEASSGKVLIEKLKGFNGKFSPDGRSLVTVDDEAFYVYTLPKGSEPIFGVFQKPEPWSPPGPGKPVKTPSKKPTKKP